MKKYIFIIVFIFGVYLFNFDNTHLTQDSIRFRVIANSNSSRDILMKELVVNELSSILFKESDINKTRENIVNNMSVIENKIDCVFKNNNYDLSYNISYGMNEFPEKEYNGIKYDAGLYESLVIEIGEGRGNNYWCFLYPSLCMIDNENVDEPAVYKSKIYELIDDFF